MDTGCPHSGTALVDVPPGEAHSVQVPASLLARLQPRSRLARRSPDRRADPSVPVARGVFCCPNPCAAAPAPPHGPGERRDDHHPERAHQPSRPPPARPPPPWPASRPRPGPSPAAAEPATGITGAQSLVRSLEAVGVEVIFGIPGGAILPAYDPLFDSDGPPRAGPPRAGRRARRHRATPRPPARSASAWRPPGPGATNLVTPLADAHMDSVPIVAITGQVPSARHRHRRLPGGRHPRHHDAGDQAQLPGHRTPTRSRSGSPRRSTSPATGRPGPGAGRHPQGRPAGDDRLRLAAAAGPARLQADHPAARQAGARGRGADRRGAAVRSSTSAAACSRPRPAPSWPSWPS